MDLRSRDGVVIGIATNYEIYASDAAKAVKEDYE